MKKLLFFLLLFISTTAFTQTETEIRKYYQEINAKITASAEQGYEGSLYQNRWVTNSNGKAWPAFGLYTDTVDFWYNDTPDHLPATERDPKKTLVKIETDGISSHMYRHEEYLFKNGILIFYFCDMKEEGMGIEI